MNLWLILVGQPGPASSRNSAGKAQRPTAVIGGRFPPDSFFRGALPEVGFGSPTETRTPITQNYPTIHAVGRASVRPPRLVDIVWGDPAAPKVTLVGKGVCFDTGGLDLKTAAGMRLMKKDMAGAAIVLGLAQAIIDAKLPVRLRVLLPLVENAVSGNAMRPLDIVRTRKGLTVEIGNADAEGRLILCDALAEAATEKPQLLIDMATLTGAARVALGPELAALFCNDEALARGLLDAAEAEEDPMWRDR
jgi:leucyl aminopeptidase